MICVWVVCDERKSDNGDRIDTTSKKKKNVSLTLSYFEKTKKKLKILLC